MPIYKGAKQITKVYQGETEIDKVYRGASKVYGADKGTEITVSGNPLVLTNVAKEKPLDTLEINGRTEQTQGYLKSFNQLSQKTSIVSVKQTLQEDGSYYCESATISSRLQITLSKSNLYDTSKLIPNHKYIMLLRCKNVDSQNIQGQLYSMSYTKLGEVSNSGTSWGVAGVYFTFLQKLSSSMLMQFYRSQGISGTCYFYAYEPKFFDVTEMYGNGKEPLTISAFEQDNPNWWLEKYTENELRETSIATSNAFPKPAYPQDIVNVQSVEVVQSGKNLFRYGGVSSCNKLTETKFQANIIDSYYASVWNIIDKAMENILLKNAGKYLVMSYESASYDLAGTSFGFVFYGSTDESASKTYERMATMTRGRTASYCQIPTNFKSFSRLELRFARTGKQHTDTVTEIENIMVYISDVAETVPSFEYEQPKPLKLATIDGIELTKWDKVVKRNGVWGVSKNHYEHTVNKVSAFYSTDNPNGNICYFPPPKYNHSVFSPTENYCDKFITTNAITTKMPLYSIGGASGASSSCWICLPKDITSLALANEYLANNPAKLIYPTVDEQAFIPLSSTIQDQLNALQIYKPTTIVSNNAECEMSASYLCYLDNAEAMLTNLYNNDLSEVLK